MVATPEVDANRASASPDDQVDGEASSVSGKYTGLLRVEDRELSPAEEEEIRRAEETAWRALEAESAPWAAESVRDHEKVYERVYREAEEEARRGRGEAIPLSRVGTRQEKVRFVARDLLPDGQLIWLIGEEGAGKTTLAYQIGCELCRGLPVLGAFEVETPIRKVMIIDVEQTEQDVAIVRELLQSRGLFTPELPIVWLDSLGRTFDAKEDYTWLAQQVIAEDPEVVVIDTATDAVSKARDDESVRPLVTLLLQLLKAEDMNVRVVIGLCQPRKEGQSKDSRGRSFDSLFGSRLWKSKCSAAFWLTETRLTVWKQRGNYLRRRWGKLPNERYPWCKLTRQAEGIPTLISAPVPEDERKEQRTGDFDAKLEQLLTKHPNEFTKTGAAKKIEGLAYQVKLDRITELMLDGVVGGVGNKLSWIGWNDGQDVEL